MIKVKNLTKRYGQHLALDNISFTVEEGEVLGFLGPNGAGKSTTMNIMTGYIASTEGEVHIGGIDIVAEPEKAKAQIGYLPETPPLYGDMRVDEYLNFVASIKKVKSSERKQMVAYVKEAVHIEDMSKRLIKNLSKGYRQRVGMAQAMLGNPKVIIMDEPTVGLDPKQIIEMREVFRKLGKKHTLILSSHIMQEVSAVCDRVMIINKGHIMASDTPERLAAGLAQGHKMLVRVKGDKDKILSALADYSIIKEVKAIASRELGTIDFELSGDENIDIREAIFSCMSANSMPLLMMKSLDLSLEEIFLQITGQEQVAEPQTEELQATQTTGEEQVS
ncbi:MAG: ABC transporter ATP-binding protein [Defluviitaleaceae bacterium]|nr:ABC transporter ATP-binding protein [Defluviitaleaceae bacterium]